MSQSSETFPTPTCSDTARVLIARAALCEAGYSDYAKIVKMNSGGDPSWRAESPLPEVAFRAFVLGHRGDPNGVPVFCSAEWPLLATLLTIFGFGHMCPNVDHFHAGGCYE
jgi:hypothetical protein